MGSAALGDAIKNIRDWAMTEGRQAKMPARVSDVFGSLVFNDQVQQARLPKIAYRALRNTDHPRRTPRRAPPPTPWRAR